MLEKLFWGGLITVAAVIALFLGWGQIQQNMIRGIMNEPWAVSAQSNPNGKITLVEFIDYSCPHCFRFSKILNDATQNDQNINIIIRPVGILGEDSTVMARLIIAAGEQNKATQLHKNVMDGIVSPSTEKIFTEAKRLGLDIQKLKSDSESDASMKILKINEVLLRSTNINGVPALVINDTPYIYDTTPDAVSLRAYIYKDIK